MALRRRLLHSYYAYRGKISPRQVWIVRTNMTTLTQMWMMLLLSNILPNDHNDDLPLPKCQLVYAIMT